MVKEPKQDIPELLSFFRLPSPAFVAEAEKHAVIERCFVEVRRRTRRMVCFVNEGSVDRIISSWIFGQLNEDWRNRSLRLFTLHHITEAA
jgi:transposase-like protein